MSVKDDCQILREECESMYQEMVRKANRIIELERENTQLKIDVMRLKNELDEERRI